MTNLKVNDMATSKQIQQIQELITKIGEHAPEMVYAANSPARKFDGKPIISSFEEAVEEIVSDNELIVNYFKYRYNIDMNMVKLLIDKKVINLDLMNLIIELHPYTK
jgi:hypothetical protein